MDRKFQGGSWVILKGFSWILGASWRDFAGSWGMLRGSWGDLARILEGSWGGVGGFWGGLAESLGGFRGLACR